MAQEIPPSFSDDLTVRFTKDMVETLEVHFDALALDGVVTIALDFRGVWIVGSDGVRLFLGAVDIPEHIKTRLRRRLT